MGANSAFFVRLGQYWRLITCMFLHGDILHLICNMYALYVVGPRVEDFFGKKKFLLIYFLSGLSGSLLSIGLNNNALSVGMSYQLEQVGQYLVYLGHFYTSVILIVDMSEQ